MCSDLSLLGGENENIQVCVTVYWLHSYVHYTGKVKPPKPFALGQVWWVAGGYLPFRLKRLRSHHSVHL